MVWMRRVLAVVLTVFVLQGPPAGAEEQAAAAETPSVSSLVSTFDVDGPPCTGVPNSIPGIFDFTQACQAHDLCYAQGVDRATCDAQFRQDMGELCEVQHPDPLDARRYACLAFADLYYAGVRLFGGFFFTPSTA